jgi:hypothetical protein
VLSIVIVTRNTRDLLDGLLSSLEADESIEPVTQEVLVVDNGSTDGTASLLEGRFPWVNHIRLPENRGFAAAVNTGYRHTSGEFVFFLNSDTRLLKGETAKMLRSMEQEPSIGISGPQLVYDDMRLQRSFALAPRLLFEFVPVSILGAVFPDRYLTKGLFAPSDVETLIGAAMMVRRDVLELLDGFDERFFFFLEETDFCLRVAKKGYRVVFLPGAKVIHLQGRTVRQSWIGGRIEFSISLYKFVKKYHSALYCKAFVTVRIAKAMLFLLPVTLLPFLFFGESIRRKYRYYWRLVAWHLHGCPDNAGLRLNSRG